MKNRTEMTDYFINQLNLRGDIVEVGCDLYGFSGYMFTRIPSDKCRFIMIDTWEPIRFYREVSQEEIDHRFNVAVATAMQYPNVYPIKGDGVVISRAFMDCSISMVYIDALHDYNSVKRDIEAWLPKVKNGGIMSGHDYHMPGVKQAVDEIFAGCDIQTAGNDGDRSWWVIKP